MNNFYKGAFFSLLSAFGFALLPIFALYAYRGHISVTTLLFLRFSIAAVLFFLYVFAKYKGLVFHKKDLFYLFILGGICYNLQARFYFSSVKYIPASLAALFLYTYPLIVTGLSFLVDREKITGKMGVSIGISFIGLILILGTSIGTMNGFGILLALGAAFVYSVYIMLGNRVLKSTPSLVASAFVAFFSSIGVLIFGFFTDGLNFSFQPVVWLPILGLVFFSTVIAILFFFRGMELIGPAKASVISMMEPVFTVILSTIFLQDRLTSVQLIGGVFVLTGASFVMRSREQKRTPGMKS